MIPHCGFDLHFSYNERCCASFYVFINHLYVFFVEMSIYVFRPFLEFFFLDTELQGLFVYFLAVTPLSVASFANIFSHSEGCLFSLFMVYTDSV